MSCESVRGGKVLMLCESVEPPLLLRQHGTLDLAQLYAAEVREITGPWGVA